MKASYALNSTRLASSQTLDDCEEAFSYPLSATCGFFVRRVISFTDVARKAILIISGMEVAGVARVPFSTTHTTLFLRLERGSFFFALILAYISWLNFVVIFAGEKKWTLTLLFKLYSTQNVCRWLWNKTMMSQGLWVY